jgi:hypothetical protein
MTKPSTPSSSSPSSSTSSPGASDHLPIPASGPGSVGQLDPTSGDYAVYRIYKTHEDPNPDNLLVTIIATRTAQPNVGQNAGGFLADMEYWQIKDTHINTAEEPCRAGIRVRKSAHSWNDSQPPFKAGEQSFTRMEGASWPTVKDNGAWQQCQVEQGLERYALSIAYDYAPERRTWGGEATFLNKEIGALFKENGCDFLFTYREDKLSPDTWYWVKDVLG